MSSNPYVPVGRLDTEPAPAGPYPTPAQREAALRDTLRGVDLGAYDERIIGWAVPALDNPTLRTLLSWVERARQAERQQTDDEIRAKIGQVFDQEARIPAAERGSRQVEQAYRDGMLRVVSALGLMDAVRPPREAEPTPECAASDQGHPAWCARGARCTSGVRAGETPEHESAPRIVPAEPGTGGDAEYRVMLTQAEGCPALVEIEAGAPDAFDETADQQYASLEQARQLAAILAELAARGGEVQ